MKKALIKLLKVKSLFSLAAIAMFIFLCVTDRITGEVAMGTISAIITYYFVKQEKEEPRTQGYVVPNAEEDDD
ncbi:MAG: hypothetical protein KBS75_09175 [Bacteroidales bacterium]|nr:hypothetical protein [Candidatus Equimonas faecalis]